LLDSTEVVTGLAEERVVKLDAPKVERTSEVR
jgi:hypothetical protein